MGLESAGPSVCRLTGLKALVCALLGVVIVAYAAPSSNAAEPPTIRTFPITGGVGDPWGTAIDAAGVIWFAESGCDFAPTCPADAPPGQIGRVDPSSRTFVHY